MGIKILTSILFVLFFVPLFSQNKIGEADLSKLKGFMAGSFSSELQAKNDSDFYDIHLQMKPIWEERKDGFWLYVEQAIVSALEKPYRQRIYHVRILNDTNIVSKVFEMKSPLRFAGAYKNVDLLKSLTLDSLEAREGCAIILHARSNGTFVGSTHQQDCLSSLRGASYATSEVVISKDKLVSWDRGWDATGKQMWGAVKSGYQFVKQMD
jgi:CpeT protein